MNLSFELQQHLDKMHSTVALSLRESGAWPGDCAWAYKNRRSIRVGFYKGAIKISFRTNSYCYVRGLSSEILRTATLIDEWLGKKLPVRQFKRKYPELELFQPFSSDKKDNNPEKEQVWNELKCFFFGEEYSNETMNFDLCTQILKTAKSDLILNRLKPYSSLGRVCFRQWGDMPNNYLCIAPKRREPVNGNFFLTLPPDEGKIDVNTMEEGLAILKDHIDQLPYTPIEG